MIPNDPFIRLIIYLFLAAVATWGVSLVVAYAKVPYPWNIIVTAALGLALLFFAFNLAGLPIFA